MTVTIYDKDSPFKEENEKVEQHSLLISVLEKIGYQKKDCVYNDKLTTVKSLEKETIVKNSHFIMIKEEGNFNIKS